MDRNIHRRQLTPSQRAMCAARARAMYDAAAKERQKARKGNQPGASVETVPQLSEGKARDHAGKAFGVSGKLVDHASYVLEHGIPELADAVQESRMSVTTAAQASDRLTHTEPLYLEKPCVGAKGYLVWDPWRAPGGLVKKSPNTMPDALRQTL